MATRSSFGEAMTTLALRLKAYKRLVGHRGQPSGMRQQGSFLVPDRQSKLDAALVGQIFYCPNCGTEHPATVSGFLTCTHCKAHYAISLGYNPQTEEATIVRVDRWK